MARQLKQPRNVGKHLCPYCEKSRGTTLDHIVPRCLFPEKVPSGVYLPTVWACRECNARKSADDGFLRDFLATHPHLKLDLKAQEIIGASSIRAMKRGQSAFLKTMQNVKDVPLISPSGLYVGNAKIGEFDMRRLHGSLARIVRALHFKIQNTFIPRDALFTLQLLDKEWFMRYFTISRHWTMPPGMWDVFMFLAGFGPPERAWSIWLMVFYDRVAVMMNVDRPASAKVQAIPR